MEYTLFVILSNLSKAGLILNIVGTLMIAYSFGTNREEAHQLYKGEKVYLASFLHPRMFKWGIFLIVIGFFLQLL
jgi:hypothetical protein